MPIDNVSAMSPLSIMFYLGHLSMPVFSTISVTELEEVVDGRFY